MRTPTLLTAGLAALALLISGCGEPQQPQGHAPAAPSTNTTSSGPTATTRPISVPRDTAPTTHSHPSPSAATTQPPQSTKPSQPMATNTQTSASPHQATPATDVQQFTPFDATGKPAIPIASTRTGSCWESSIALDAPNAYRCMAHNAILDPCFAHPDHPDGFLVCVAAPWDAGTKLELTQPLPTPTTRTLRPWALELANGHRCVAATGTVSSVAGVTIDYFCDSNGGAGGLKRNGSEWTIDYLPPHSTNLTRVSVTTAWG